MPRAQSLANRRAVEAIGDDASDAALHPEDLHAGKTAAGAAAVLVAACRSAELVAARNDVLIQPAEVPPGGADLDEPLELRMVPVRDVSASADVRHDQMVFGVMAVREPELLDRPAAKLYAGALHVLVPGEGTVMRAAVVVRKFRSLAVQEHYVVIAACG